MQVAGASSPAKGPPRNHGNHGLSSFCACARGARTFPAGGGGGGGGGKFFFFFFSQERCPAPAEMVGSAVLNEDAKSSPCATGPFEWELPAGVHSTSEVFRSL